MARGLDFELTDRQRQQVMGLDVSPLSKDEQVGSLPGQEEVVRTADSLLVTRLNQIAIVRHLQSVHLGRNYIHR